MGTPSTQLRRGTPIYSPENVAVEPIIVKFNGTFDFPSIYHGPPAPEIDAAWDRISTDVRPMRMTLEEMRKAGEADSPSKVRYPDKIGGGFMVSLESAHELHCLNLLRKNRPSLHRNHQAEYHVQCGHDDGNMGLGGKPRTPLP
ncbi:hypothetical protein AZE42_10748 [Rhizopogon vesiculosus]|uniref:Uncharacterized protein n=1 Tax=Rhizopogon vesiculosus TaxID=180088 RepID=A0A1J8QPK4_9AGAM|nr:hypothetical protein AZE42_10748 [Rhizopogon vesiculosus]